VKKDLRYAILRGFYEYDVKSSVVSWKYAFAQEYMSNANKIGDAETEFSAISYFLSNKAEYFSRLLKDVFEETEDLTHEEKIKIIKQAMTALSFGAKLVEKGWKNIYGKEEEGSISKLFGKDYKTEKNRFINSQQVKDFKMQQKILDDYIVGRFWSEYAWLADIKEINGNKRRSKSKILAWLYQHAETIMMDIVRGELDKLGVGVKANIHDAIVVDRQLTAQERAHIESVVQQQTNVDGFALGETLY
jgi:hypothetical protein